MEGQRVLSMESLLLLDGLVYYLGAVVKERAPEARWEIARHRIKRYHLNAKYAGGVIEQLNRGDSPADE